MREDQAVLLGAGIAAAVVIAVVAIVSRRTASIRQLLGALASSAGWTDLRSVFMAAGGVKGMWRSFPVELAYQLRQKSVPERLVLKVRVQTDTRLIVKRKFHGLFSNRPFTFFGPPVVEVHQPSAAEFWIRSDEAGFAERLFSDAALAAKIGENLVGRFDEIRIDRRGLKVVRALDERLVRTKYNMPAFTMTFDASRFEPIAREELALSEALVNKLSVAR